MKLLITLVTFILTSVSANEASGSSNHLRRFLSANPSDFDENGSANRRGLLTKLPPSDGTSGTNSLLYNLLCNYYYNSAPVDQVPLTALKRQNAHQVFPAAVPTLPISTHILPGKETLTVTRPLLAKETIVAEEPLIEKTPLLTGETLVAKKPVVAEKTHVVEKPVVSTVVETRTEVIKKTVEGKKAEESSPVEADIEQALAEYLSEVNFNKEEEGELIFV